jgi:hypothetical protein
MRLSKSVIVHRVEVPPTPLPGASCRERACELGAPMNINQVAQLIGCSCWTVRQTLVPRGLPFFRFATQGRMVFYRKQVIAWIENEQAKRGGISRPRII